MLSRPTLLVHCVSFILPSLPRLCCVFPFPFVKRVFDQAQCVSLPAASEQLGIHPSIRCFVFPFRHCTECGCVLLFFLSLNILVHNYGSC